MSQPGSREGGRPQLRGGPRPHRLAGVTKTGTRRRRGRLGPRRAFAWEARWRQRAEGCRGQRKGAFPQTRRRAKTGGKPARMRLRSRSERAGGGAGAGARGEKQSWAGEGGGRLQPCRGEALASLSHSLAARGEPRSPVSASRQQTSSPRPPPHPPLAPRARLRSPKRE